MTSESPDFNRGECQTYMVTAKKLKMYGEFTSMEKAISRFKRRGLCGIL